MNSLRVVRKVAAMQRRNISTDIFENKNKIAEVRKAFYSNPETGAANPTYLKEAGDNITTGLGLGAITVGFVLILNGFYKMAYGKK